MDPFSGREFSGLLLRLAPVLGEWIDAARRGEGPVLVQRPVDAVLRDLEFERWVREGGADLGELVRRILADSNRLRHPRCMGHQVAAPMTTSAVADLVHALTNNAMAVYEMGPAVTAIERGLIRWLLAQLPWTGDGVLTHGGSLANLTALLAARERAFPGSRDGGVPPGAALVASATAHYSVARAASILGLGRVVPVDVDAALHMEPAALEATLQRLRREGRPVAAVVANAGATPTGAYDPLGPIAEICRAAGVWLHVDGAHGASALLSPKLRGRMEGAALADSLSWDAHKLLGTSTLCAALLMREAGALAGAFAQEAPYLSGAERPGEDLFGRTFECSKAGLSLKLFFGLAALGERGLAAHVERLFERASTAHAILTAAGRECFGPPESNIVCFRGTDAERDRLVREGDFYITRTSIRGGIWLRLALMNPGTRDEDLRELARRLEDPA